ncbi:MAG: hypothetical protein K6D96_06345 [Acetatifactor sp.]|nr:hypothetical protein [Acetatifactor sp.]
MKKLLVVLQFVLIVLFVAGGVIAIPKIRINKEKAEEIEKMKETKVVLYEGPKTLRDATEEDLKNTAENNRDFSLLHCTDTKVFVNGQESYVYDTNVNHTRTWVSSYYPPQARTPVTYFDFEGVVTLTVTVPDIDIKTVKVSPLSYGIEADVDTDAHTVTFTVDKPDNYTVQFNDSPERALHIFAFPLETEEEKAVANDPATIYIGPGEWDMDNISLSSGQTLYIAGGAVVHGTINSSFCSNMTVCGHGILDGSKIEGWKGTTAYVPLKFDHCSGVTLKDIIVLNPNAWVVQQYDSKDGILDGLKIISSRPNGDGISMQSCQNYEVKNIFVRSWDDSLVVKNYDQSTDNLYFHDIQIWTDLAQSMEVGFETNKGKKPDSAITNVTFENITVLNNFHKPVISVHNADDALVKDIFFKNITVEHEEIGSGDCNLPFLIDIAVVQNSQWSSTAERGTIENVVLENVNFLSGSENVSRIKGFDPDHGIKNVTFKNVNILGTDVKSAEDGNIKVDEETVSGVTFE